MGESPKGVSLGVLGALAPCRRASSSTQCECALHHQLPVASHIALVDCCWYCWRWRCSRHCNACPLTTRTIGLQVFCAARQSLLMIIVWTQPPSCPATYKLLKPNRTAPNGDSKQSAACCMFPKVLDDAVGCRRGHPRAMARIRYALAIRRSSISGSGRFCHGSWKIARTSSLRPNDWLERLNDMRDLAAPAHCEEVGQCSRAARRRLRTVLRCWVDARILFRAKAPLAVAQCIVLSPPWA
ncbi:hypothetical protein PSPO01_14222 [Paraphaeosphaeria sporulosa]